MNESQYINLQKKQWRSITYNFDELASSYGNQSRLYCLTDFQVAWLLSNTEYMRWSTRWVDCPCTQNDLEAMKAELDYNLMSCYDVQPWQLDFVYDRMVTEQLNELDTLYDGVNPDSINPEAPNDDYDGDGSAERLNALCTTCKIYCYSYAENWLKVATAFTGIAQVVTLATKIIPVGGIIAGIVLKGLTYMLEVAVNAMQDEVALDNVVCCMNSNLTGQALTSANFETALDGCSFGVGSNEAIIRDIIASDLDQFGNWMSFVNQLGNSYVLAENGVYDCPCESTWEHTFDFLVGDGGFTVWSPPANANVFGQWVFGQGWITTDSLWSNTPVTQYRRAVAIERDFAPNTKITELTFVYDMVKGSFSSSVTALVEAVQLSGSTLAVVTETSGAIVSGADKSKTLVLSAIANNLKFFVSSSSQSTAVYSGSVAIKSCTVKGTGFNPF